MKIGKKKSYIDKDRYLKIFNELHKCDYCCREFVEIAQIVIIPIHKPFVEVTAYLEAKKCHQCVIKKKIKSRKTNRKK